MMAKCGQDRSTGNHRLGRADTKLIYAIDDDGLVRTFLEHALASGGYPIECFSDAASLIAATQRKQPALFLIDIRMPETSGEEMVATLRSLPGCEDTPILVITGSGRLDRVSAALQAGAQGFLLKPFSPEQAMSAVRRWLG